jgi:NAD(P)-dependent dehydrogenase (short-subunit alcohol dehydrogenase family)
MRVHAITGGASGIGAALAERLRGEGHRVITIDLHRADVVADLSRPQERARMAEAVAAACGGTLDGLAVCAGISRQEPATVAVNYFGAVEALRLLRPLLEAAAEPRAVAITSIAATFEVGPEIVAACLAGDEHCALAACEGRAREIYPSSKRALAQWCRAASVRAEWAGCGILLNAVAPGLIETPMTADALRDPEGARHLAEVLPQPTGRHGTPQEVAALLAWLLSPANTMMVGQQILLDNGSDAVRRPAA